MAKLLELIDKLKDYKRIKRENWMIGIYLVKSEYDFYPLIKCNFASLEMEKYALTYEDLIAGDWQFLD